MTQSAGPSATSTRAQHTETWSAYRDPAARRAAVAGARPPLLPLTQHQALEQAIRLSRLGLSARAVSLIMGHYHGWWATGPTWWGRIRRART